MFAADCPTKRAAFMTDMTPGRWSHVPALVHQLLKLLVLGCLGKLKVSYDMQVQFRFHYFRLQCVCVWVYACVCVDYLNRCKTSIRYSDAMGFCHGFDLWFYFISCRGMECASDVSIQRRRICCTVIWIGDAQSTYLLNLFRNGKRLNPRTSMSSI